MTWSPLNRIKSTQFTVLSVMQLTMADSEFYLDNLNLSYNIRWYFEVQNASHISVRLIINNTFFNAWWSHFVMKLCIKASSHSRWIRHETNMRPQFWWDYIQICPNLGLLQSDHWPNMVWCFWKSIFNATVFDQIQRLKGPSLRLMQLSLWPIWGWWNHPW